MKSIAKRKTTTSSEVKERYNAKTYQRYTVRLRKEDDAELVRYIESKKDIISTSELFKEGIERLKNEGF